MTSSNSSDQPTIGADGQQVWNPSVGIHLDINNQERESYGGIIAALQDHQYDTGRAIRAYPENFAGIIAAIQDLQKYQYTPGSDVGDKPPGGNIIIDPDTGEPIYIENGIVDGQLWFDTRQGRLLVSISGNWYQTNGADGLPYLTDDISSPPTGVVPGQFWWVRGTNELYIFDGYYVLPDNSITEDPSLGGDPVWKLIANPEDGAFQTTMTLPLGSIGPVVAALVGKRYLPEVDANAMAVQANYNQWLYDALVNLDQGLTNLQPVTVDQLPPADPSNGALWYDIERLELSIWYEDGDSGQWVPTSVVYKDEDDLVALRDELEIETRAREVAVHDLQLQLAEIRSVDAQSVVDLENSLTLLETKVDALPVVDVSGFATTHNLHATRSAIENRLANLERGPDLSAYAKQHDIDAALTSIRLELADCAASDALNEVEASIPDVSSFVTQAEIDASIAGITVEYLPRTGGTLTGSFVVQKQDYALPGFDFSTSSWHSKDAFKLVAPGTGATPTTFGTTDDPWEVAWNFAGDEDFCWSHQETGKQLSVSKDGVACESLFIGDFLTNDDQGRRVTNTIDVKDRLQRYQSAFTHLRQGVFEATDLDTLKANIITALANI